MQKQTQSYMRKMLHGILHQIYVCLKQEYKAEKGLGLTKILGKPLKGKKQLKQSKVPRDLKS